MDRLIFTILIKFNLYIKRSVFLRSIQKIIQIDFFSKIVFMVTILITGVAQARAVYMTLGSRVYPITIWNTSLM